MFPLREMPYFILHLMFEYYVQGSHIQGNPKMNLGSNDENPLIQRKQKPLVLP